MENIIKIKKASFKEIAFISGFLDPWNCSNFNIIGAVYSFLSDP